MPTKQLCDETAKLIEMLCEGTTMRTQLCRRNLKHTKEFDILIGTPRQAIDYLSKCEHGIVDQFAYLVIDEADLLLDDAYVDVMTELFAILPINTHNIDKGSF